MLGKVPLEIRNEIIKILDNNENIDYITLSCYLMYSGYWARDRKNFVKNNFWKRFTKKFNGFNIEECKNYLNNINVVHMDWKDLFNEYKNNNNVIFIVDPPYSETFTQSYDIGYRWDIRDDLKLIEILKKPFILFNIKNAPLLNFIDFINNNYNADINYKKVEKRSRGTNKQQTWFDEIMIYNI